MNRAFYGIMSSKSLMSADGKYTNAVYGFLSILFKDLEDLKEQGCSGAIIGKALYEGKITLKELQKFL